MLKIEDSMLIMRVEEIIIEEAVETLQSMGFTIVE